MNKKQTIPMLIITPQELANRLHRAGAQCVVAYRQTPEANAQGAELVASTCNAMMKATLETLLPGMEVIVK